MKSKFIVLLLLAATLCVAGENYSGFLDTTSITETLTTGTTVYTDPYKLSKFEDIRLIVKCDDTTSAVFATDSVAFFYGYQTGTIVLDSAGARDTIYDDPMTIDSMLASEFGTLGSGTMTAAGVLTRTWGGADTLSVTGYAVQSRWFVPEWDYLIRFWVTALGDNLQASPLVLFLEPKRRLEIPTR